MRVNGAKFLWTDSMAQWQECRPECWEAWGPEFNPRPGRVWVRVLYKLGQPPKTFTSYSSMSVAQLFGEITLKSFIFISYHRSGYLCRLHIYIHIKRSPSDMSEPPLKKGGEPFIKKKRRKRFLWTLKVSGKRQRVRVICGSSFEMKTPLR